MKWEEKYFFSKKDFSKDDFKKTGKGEQSHDRCNLNRDKQKCVCAQCHMAGGCPQSSLPVQGAVSF